MSGTIQAIYITPVASQPMRPLKSVKAIAGVGLEGDRYAAGVGFYSNNPTTPGAREVTLIAEESIEQAARDAGVTLEGRDTRRNLITRGVDLRQLLGKRFAIGEVICEGVRDCAPCIHLDALTGKRIMPHLVYSGGLRARIVEGGVISVGDAIVVTGEAEGPVHGGHKSV